MSLWLERLYPYILGGAATYAAWRWKLPFPAERDLLSASITIGAVFAGFLATLQSIVASAPTEKFQKLKQSRGHFATLLGYIHSAVWISLLYSSWCLLGYFLDFAKIPLWYPPVWAGLSILLLLAFYRVSKLLLELMK